MAILGMRDTSNFVANQRPENWREALLLLYPNSADAAKAPLTALTSLMGSESTDDPVYHWWEKTLDDRRLKLAADATDVATTLTINTTWKDNATAKIAKAGDILLVEETGELMEVTADPSAAGSITVARGVAGTTPTAVGYNDAGKNPFLLIIGSAFEEGSLAPSGVNYDPREKYNYTQIFRSTLEMTRTASKTRLRTGDQVKEARREALEYIGIDLEKAFWFGRRYATTKNGRPQRFMGGFQWYLQTFASGNIVNRAGVAIDMDWVDEQMELIFRYGSSEKIVFAGNLALLAIQAAVRKNTSYQIFQGEKEYGIRVTRLVSPYGELVFKVHPIFNQITGGTSNGQPYYGMNSWAAVVDQAKLKYRYLKDSDVKYEGDLTEIGRDGMKSGFLGECGIEMQFPETHFLFKGLTGGAVDS